MIFWSISGGVLIATQRLKELSQKSLTANEGHLTGKEEPPHALFSDVSHSKQPEFQTGQEDLTTQAADKTASMLQQGLPVVQNKQSDLIDVQVVSNTGKQVYY